MTEALFGFLGVIVGSILPWVKDSLTARKERNRNAQYLAIRVACTLNKYVNDCAQAVSDDGTCMGQPANADGTHSPQKKTPTSPLYPEDVDWKSIDSSLMFSLLSLPNEAESADRSIDAVSEHADPPDYEEFFEERRYQYACLGLKALDLEKRIRIKYGIPLELITQWNPYDYFMNGKIAVETSRANRNRASEELSLQISFDGGSEA